MMPPPGVAGERRSGREMDAVLRFAYEPLRGFIETIGAMILLFRRTLVASLTPPFNYGPELVDQFLFALRLGWFPMILASLAFTYGPAGIEVGNFLNLLGALDPVVPRVPAEATCRDRGQAALSSPPRAGPRWVPRC